MKKTILISTTIVAVAVVAAHIALSVFIHPSYCKVIRYRIAISDAVETIKKHPVPGEESGVPYLGGYHEDRQEAEMLFDTLTDELVVMGYLVETKIPLKHAQLWGGRADLSDELMRVAREQDFAPWRASVKAEDTGDGLDRFTFVTIIDRPCRSNKWIDIVNKYDMPQNVEITEPSPAGDSLKAAPEE
jgi:hypothetical protein